MNCKGRCSFAPETRGVPGITHPAPPPTFETVADSRAPDPGGVRITPA